MEKLKDKAWIAVRYQCWEAPTDWREEWFGNKKIILIRNISKGNENYVIKDTESELYWQIWKIILPHLPPHHSFLHLLQPNFPSPILNKFGEGSIIPLEMGWYTMISKINNKNWPKNLSLLTTYLGWYFSKHFFSTSQW